MSQDAPPAPESDPPLGVLEALRRIKSRQLDPALLSQADRRSCVAHLRGEGLQQVEIADILKVSAKTVSRDCKAIAQENALKPNPDLTSEMAGMLLSEAEQSVAHIRRAARHKSASPSVQIDGAKKRVEIYNLVIVRLQSMGLVAEAAQQLEADVRHHSGDLATLAELKAEVDRLDALARDPTLRMIDAPEPPPEAHPPPESPPEANKRDPESSSGRAGKATPGAGNEPSSGEGGAA